MAPGDLSLRVKDFFHFLTKHYAICEKSGMNPVYKDSKKRGDFVTVHCLKPQLMHYALKYTLKHNHSLKH